MFFSLNGGSEWVRLKSGIPDIAIRDMTIQKREDALILGSFGRGIYILDDINPLRQLAGNRAILDQDAFLFNIPRARMYIQTEGKYGQGATLFHAPNPPFGATFTYYLREVPKTLKEMRHEKEKKLFSEKKPIPQPDTEELRKEEHEIPPYLVFTVTGGAGDIVRRITASPKEGINKVTWDLRYDSPFPVKTKDGKFNPVAKPSSSMLAIPGTYHVSMDIVVRGEVRHLSDTLAFQADLLNNSTLPREKRDSIVAFAKKVSDLARVMRGTYQLAGDNVETIAKMEQTILESSDGSMEMLARAMKIEKDMRDVIFTMEGPKPKASEEELPPMPVPLNNRLDAIIANLWTTTHGVTSTMQTDFRILSETFPPLLRKMQTLDGELKALEEDMNKTNIPWTPGRVPEL